MSASNLIVLPRRHRASPARSGRSRGGFTLIEILIVIAIILALGAIVGVALFKRRDQADVDTTKIQLKQIKDALDLFYLDFRRYPNDDEGIAVLWDKEQLDPDADATKWKQYLATKIPTDQWGDEWGYRGEEPEHGEKYDLWSWGPDREDDTDDDITTWSQSDDEEGGDLGSDLPAPPSSGGP
ncbi:MAG: type II secretion system major pseudopilin GspG [Phycisphaeraceae bacterium]|nr:MAG: type II secretion system major pseudopilin GspG [Phycisphaeraceae bacterium]